MSFIGSLPTEVRRVLASWVPEIKYPVINVCAGNFTIASILRSAGYEGEISGCDVTLYTSALGAALTDSKLDISEKADCPDHLRGLIDTNEPMGAAASIALLYDLRQVWKMKNPFQQRTVETYQRKWPELMDKTIKKLEAYKKHIGKIKYQVKDGFEVLAQSDKNHTIITAPPIYKGDYEKLDKLLTTVCAWDPPEYKPMLDKDLEIYKLIKRFEDYFVVIYKDMPEIHEILGKPSSVVLPRGRGGNTLRVITSRAKRKMVVRHYVKSEEVGAYLPANYQVTGREKITLAQITTPQSIRMNELFASARINTFTGGVAESIVFLLDGQVFGKADFCKSAHVWKIPGDEVVRPMIYLMSDLVVPNVTNRLTKLVLLSLLSKEVKKILDLRFTEDFFYVLTTAFTARPASMKYRGIFKMHKRMKDPDGYRINYYARFGKHGLKGAIKKWNRKYNTK